MRKAAMLPATLLLPLLVAAAWGQSPPPPPPPPPCGEKGVPDNVPCYDVKSGKLLHTASPINVPSQPLTKEQKAVLNGPAPTPEPIETEETQKSMVPRNIPNPSTNQQPALGLPPGSTAQEQTPPASVDTRGRITDDQEWKKTQVQKQREYEAGYALGQAIGAAVQDRLTLHSITKTCKKGAGKVRLANGGVVDCVRWNAGERAITYPPSPAVARQNAKMAETQREILRLQADTATIYLDTMEMDRSTINKETEAAREGIFYSGEQYWQRAFRDWEDIRNSYCQAAPSGHYIDLEGTSTTCNAPHSTEAEQLERLNRQLARSAAAVMESKRDLINTFKDTPGASPLIESARKDWAQAQETFCKAAPEGTYIDTDGKEETCPP